MNYVQYLNYLCKFAVILIGAMFLRPILDYLEISQFHLPTLLAHWFGRTGIIFIIAIGTIGIPLLVSAFIGILGGLWIGEKAINGFILSLAFYLWEFTIQISTVGLKYDLMTFLSFIGLVIVPVVGTLIYAVFSKRCRARNCAVTTATTT